jgi:hypothetical protein
VRALLAVVFTVALTATARADEPDDKSPTGAILLSSTGTLAAYLTFVRAVDATDSSRDLRIGISAAAWIALPSLGHWYAHDWVSKGFVIRTLGLAGIALGARQTCEDDPCGGDFLVIASIGAVITGTIWDIASAPSAADEYNASHAHATLAPAVLTPPSGPVVGLGINGTF